MKKILLATTMLIGTAGFAAAEVTVSGDARVGIVDAGGAAGAVFDSRARVSFSLSGESDSGISFGASFRADNAVGASEGSAGSVSVSGAFGKLSMGSNDSAAQAGVGQVAGVGYTGNGDLNEISYLGNGAKPNVLYTYSAGALTVMASVGQTSGDERSVAAAYAGEGFGVSVGIEDVGLADNHVVIGANTSVSGIALKAVYGSLGDLSQYAVSATYTADALSVTVFYADDSEMGTDGAAKASGLGVGYDLGGGASFAAGYSKDQAATSGRFDAGLNFSF